MRNYANLTVTIPKELYHWLMAYKKRRYISLSALVTDLIKKWKGEQSV